MHIVAFNGPEPREFQITGAINNDEAISLALQKLADEGLDPNDYSVTHTYGPDEIPHFDDPA